MQEFEQILKSCNSRAEVVAAVVAEAEARVAKRGGTESLSEAEAKIWRKHPEAIAKYESLPKQAAKREEPLIRITHAEAELDSRARRVMKRDGLTYPAACSKVLTYEDPSLYTRYVEQMSRGEVYSVPDPVSKSNSGGEEDDAECSSCHGAGESHGATCQECGGTGLVDAQDDTDTDAKKRMLLAKLDSVDSLERRLLKVEAALKTRR